MNNSDLSDKSNYKRKRRNNKKSHQKNDPIKLCTKLTAKLLTTAYKSKIIKLKLDEDLLQRRIYFLTLIESLEIIYSQYKETCEVLLFDPKITGKDIKYFINKANRNLLHANIDVHRRRLIAEFPGYR